MSLSKPIGILGAGRAGTALARAAARGGVEVRMASTRTPAQMRYHLLQYAPSATAVHAQDIAQGVEIVLLAVPQEDLDDVEPAWIGDRILVDATNRWEEEPLPAWFELGLAEGLSSSEVVARRFPAARVVKALNHISHWGMDAPRSSEPRAAAIASNDAAAAAEVARLVMALGFEPVIASNLSAGIRTEPGTAYFNVAATPEQMSRHLL